jgi:hypothetical protein
MKKVELLVLLLLSIVSIQAQTVTVKKEGMKSGLVDEQGNWVIQPEYDMIRNHRYIANTIELSIIDEDNVTHGLCDMRGRIILPCEFWSIKKGEIDHTIEAWKGDENDHSIGLFDMEGNTIVPCEYFSVEKGENNTIEVTKKIGDHLSYGLYDMDGRVIIPCNFRHIDGDEEGVYFVVENDKHYKGVYNRDGKLILDVEYACFSNYEKCNKINKGGKIGKDGALEEGGKWGACDSLYNIIIPCEYDGIGYEFEGLVAVNRGGKTLGEYSETKGGKWGFWGDGKEIIPCQYDEVSEFENGLATVKKGGNVELIKNPLKDASQIQIAGNTSPLNKKERGPVVSRYHAPDSDVDKNIPETKKQAETTFAFIIANENYTDAPVPYSLNDGRMFREYCQKALGLPEKNINLYEDATFGTIITAVEKMKSLADAYDGDANVIFYYAGHGFPDEKQNSAYLLPIDGDASSITTTGYSLAKLYKEISQLKLKSSILFLDACFSGAKREDQMLAQSRGVAIKVKSDVPEGKILVFSAAQGDETAHQMEDKYHGLFTYYLLKGIQSMGSDVEMGALTEYVTKQVKRQSVVINNKKQTPTVIPSQDLTNTWQTLKMR